MLRIAVAGASGRMGRMLIEAVSSAADMTLSGALDLASSTAIGTDPLAFLGKASEVRVTADLEQGLGGADVLIDFTRPEGTLANVAACRRNGIRMVATTPDTDTAHTAVDYRGAVAVAVGTEKEGLTPLALGAADARVRIPMVGRVNSLNAATAAAVVLYEAVRQRSG